MNLKTFQAESLPRAIALVKKELGPAAIILHTRTFKRGGILGIGARVVVEITASSDVNIAAPRGGRRHNKTQAPAPAAGPTRPAAPAPQSPPLSKGSLLQRTYQAPSNIPAPRPAVPSPNRPAARQSEPPAPSAPAASPAARDDSDLNQEIRMIRRMVDQLLQRQAPRPEPSMPDELFSQYLSLLEQEVSQELADDLIRGVRQALGEADLTNQTKVRNAVNASIAALIPAGEPIEPATPRAKGKPFTLALVGPTGVGKTTTVAKLAATFKLRQKKNVGLITIDTYRIAAVDQLKTYADIIGLPLRVVTSPQEMKQAVSNFAGCDTVLIDTAGRSQRDDEKIDHLGQFMEVARPDQIHLVLSSTCSQKVMMEAADRFMKVRYDRIIFTKLDEAVSFGVLLNVVRKVNKQLSFLTTGQEVPHQIEPASSDRVADLILGGKV